MNTTQNTTHQTPKKRKFRWLRRTLRVLLGILVFLCLLLLFVRSPWGQGIIVNKAIKFVSNKTGTKVAIEKLFITFDGDVHLNGLYIEDKKGDTLVYSKSLEADIPLWRMIRGEAVGVDALDWDGLRANIIRKDSVSGYNFQFFIDAFASSDATTAAKETTSTPLNLSLGNLNFKNFDIVFDDAVVGIDSRFKIGTLNANMKTTNIEDMIFDASDIELTDANIKFIQKPVAINSTTSNVQLPQLSIKNLAFNNVVAYYESQPNHLIADICISEFSVENPIINLADSDFQAENIKLKRSKISLTTKAESDNLSKQVSALNPKNTPNNKAFDWPNLKLNISTIHFENNSISYNVGNAKPKKGIFNPDAIAVSKFTLQAKDITLKDKKATLDLEQLNFNEISGLNLKQLAVSFKATDKHMRLDNLKFRLNDNAISGYAKLDYESLSKLIETPKTTELDLNIPVFSLSLLEMFKFQPDLKNSDYLNKLSKKQLTGNLNASGNLASIDITNARINWGNETKISAIGTLQNITNPETLSFDIPTFTANTKKSDIIKFISEKDLGISLPANIMLVAQLKGNLEAASAKSKLSSNQGIIFIDGSFKNIYSIAYDASVRIEDYKLNELLNNPQFGSLSLTLNSKGTGDNINNLNANLEAIISEFQINNYAIKNLSVNGEINDGTGNILSSYKDDNLNANLNAFIVLDSITPEATLNIDVIGANLQALGLMDRNVKTAMNISADFKGNTDNYDANVLIDNGVVVYDNRSYLLGDLNAFAHIESDTTSISIKNKIIDIDLKSNADPQTFSKAIKRHVLRYFYRDETVLDTLTNFVNLQLEGKISESPLLNDVFLVNIKDLDTINFALNFNEKARKLKANITAPHVNYSGNELDSLAFSMTTDKEKFNFHLGFKNIIAGPFDVPKTLITGEQSDQELALNFLSYHEGEKLLNVNTKISGSSDLLKFKVNPDSLILNKRQWKIPDNNEVFISKNNLEFNDFVFSKDNQSVGITNKAKNTTKNHIALEFYNFKISEFFNYLNPESKLATGQLNGDFILEDPFINTGIIADLSIVKLEVLKTDLGTLSINGNSLTTNNYAFNAGLKGGDINFDLVGDYTVNNNKANLDLDFDINEFKMSALNTLSLGEIKDTNGSFSGNFKVTGTTTDPQYNGIIKFNDAGFNVAKLNTKFTMVNERLMVNNEGLSMTDFTIRDENNNALILSGKVGTKRFINPTFDLSIKATNFQVLNSTKKDNKAFYGKASFNANAQLTGDLQIPKLDAKLTLGSDTNFTYVMPSSVANIEERYGVVVFVNRENPNAILTQTEEQTATIKGFDISSILKVGKNAAVTIVIDEETGDNFKVSGEGDFIFNMSPNGRITLTGGYEISEGHYELNLYNLVNRKFLIAKGSRVTWSGDPFDAKLDVRAIYNVETSASSLMAAQISGADPSIKTKYKQVLPFNVYLNIDGELMQPEISFQLDMPEEQQGAIGGQIYGRVLQVNQQEGELNRQVFSLLVLNRFYPEPGSDGSGGGFATIAKDNLNDAVSEQLNTFSDKLLGNSGIDLDFGLNSYTDYQGDAPTDRTQLDIAAQKKLFNDRLTVRVGSEVNIQGSSSSTGEEAPLIGNISLEYTLTEDGRYRLKGFRKSEFENVIDGQTIVSGIGLIFTQEFNQFSELWDAILRSKKEEKAKRKMEEETAKKNTEKQQKATNKSIEKKKN